MGKGWMMPSPEDRQLILGDFASKSLFTAQVCACYCDCVCSDVCTEVCTPVVCSCACDCEGEG
jgi:hypothetical protein